MRFLFALSGLSLRAPARAVQARQVMTATSTDDAQRQEILDAQARVRDLMASGASTHELLSDLVRLVERATPSGMIGSILILDPDRRRLMLGGAPSLPDEYNAAIDGIEIGPEVGSCGTAAYHDRTVSVYDIATNPLWQNFRDLALRYDLRACWSTPIHGSDGKVLGTFANYYRNVRDPSPVDLQLTELITSAAATVIERHRAE